MPWLLLLPLALVAAAAAWLRHRRRVAAMERRLAWSEASRFELVHQMQAADEELQAARRALLSQEQQLQSARELAERRTAVERVLAEAPAAEVAPPTEWPDTLPFGPAGQRYAETMPADLGALPPRR